MILPPVFPALVFSRQRPDMEWITGIIGAAISGTLVALTIGAFKVAVTIRDLANRVGKIEKWIMEHGD